MVANFNNGFIAVTTELDIGFTDRDERTGPMLFFHEPILHETVAHTHPGDFEGAEARGL